MSGRDPLEPHRSATPLERSSPLALLAMGRLLSVVVARAVRGAQRDVVVA